MSLIISRRAITDAPVSIKKAMREYHTRSGDYIRDFQTLKTELSKNGIQWEALRDPWGQPYIYRSPGEKSEFDLYTLGSDRKQGGEGDARDIGNW